MRREERGAEIRLPKTTVAGRKIVSEHPGHVEDNDLRDVIMPPNVSPR